MIARLKQDKHCVETFHYTLSILLPNGERYSERKKIPVKGKTLAEQWLQQRVSFILSNPDKLNKQDVRDKLRLEDAFNLYFASKQAGKSKPSYLNFINHLYKKHLHHELGIIHIQDVETHTVHKFYQKLSQELNPASVKNVLQLLKSIFNYAKDLDYINVLPKFPTVTIVKPELETLSSEDLNQYWSMCNKLGCDYKLLLGLLLYTGMRKGEVLALKWDDVDLDKNVIYVRRSKWREIEGKTKSNKMRVIPINPKLRTILLDCKNDSIFVNKFDSESSIRAAIKKITNGKSEKLHIFRHTFASYLINTGVSITVVKELLGHSDLTSTMIYLHSDRNQLKSAVDKL